METAEAGPVDLVMLRSPGNQFNGEIGHLTDGPRGTHAS
jgi:hypothetical protein